MFGQIDSLFPTRSHPLTPFSTHSYPMPPFFNNSQPIFDNLSPNDPFFVNILLKFSIFSELFVKQNMPKFVLILTERPPFWSSHWMTPLFVEKSLTERPLVLSYSPNTPVPFKVECPLPQDLICQNCPVDSSAIKITSAACPCPNDFFFTLILKMRSHPIISWLIWSPILITKKQNKKTKQTKKSVTPPP